MADEMEVTEAPQEESTLINIREYKGEIWDLVWCI